MARGEVSSGSLLLQSSTPGRYVEAPLVAAAMPVTPMKWNSTRSSTIKGGNCPRKRDIVPCGAAVIGR